MVFCVTRKHTCINAHSYGLQWTPFHHHSIDTDPPVTIHTQSHQITFQECWSASIIHKLPDSTPTTFAASLKQHTNSSFSHVTPLDSTSHLFHPHHSSTYNLLSVFPTLLLKKVTVSGQSFSSVSYQLSAGPTTQTSCLGKCRSVTPIIFIIIHLSSFTLLCYIIIIIIIIIFLSGESPRRTVLVYRKFSCHLFTGQPSDLFPDGLQFKIARWILLLGIRVTCCSQLS